MSAEKKIIIADDDREVAASLQQALSPYACVDVVYSASGAIEAVSSGQYESVILDVRFEYGMSGFEAAAIIRADFPNVRIVIVSAVDYSTDVQQRTVDLRAQFLQKAVKTKDLLRALGLKG